MPKCPFANKYFSYSLYFLGQISRTLCLEREEGRGGGEGEVGWRDESYVQRKDDSGHAGTLPSLPVAEEVMLDHWSGFD